MPLPGAIAARVGFPAGTELVRVPLPLKQRAGSPSASSEAAAGAGAGAASDDLGRAVAPGFALQRLARLGACAGAFFDVFVHETTLHDHAVGFSGLPALCIARQHLRCLPRYPPIDH